ncbi:MAG TPA: MarR family transcriptional regulator [Candidatus Dormibacteraeota bacterium]
MTITLAPPALQTEIKDALLAYLDALTLAEPIQARLWQQAEITLTQLSLLRELRQGPKTAGRLADALGISATSATRLVDRLERRGLVDRRRDTDDRRCVEIHLAPAGERLLGEIRVLRGTDLHAAVGSMTSAERRRLTAGLRRLVDLVRARSFSVERAG